MGSIMIEAWAIKAPDGRLIKVQLHRRPALYNPDKALGYRCVRVRVEEIESKPAKTSAANTSNKE